MKRTTIAALCACVVFVVASATAVWNVRHGGNWSFDGYNYGTRMLVDRGVPFERARALSALPFKAQAAADPRIAALLRRPVPQYWHLFAPRVVYPWLASRLWPRFGSNALIAVASISYVAAMAALFFFLLEFSPPAVAAAVTIVVSQLPDIRLFARSSLTDMTAFALVTLSLWFLVRHLRTSGIGSLVLYFASVFVLSFTHPATYFIFFAAAAGLLAAWRRNDRRAIAPAMRLTIVAFLGCLAYVAAAHVAGSPSWMSTMKIESAQRWPGLSVGAWYARALMYATVWGASHALSMVLPPLGFAVLLLNRRRAAIAALLGSTLAIVPSLLLDPISGDVARTTLLPALPAFCCGVAIGLTALFRRAVPVSSLRIAA